MIELAKLNERKVTPLELLSLPDPGAAVEEAQPEKKPARRTRRKKGEGEADAGAEA